MAISRLFFRASITASRSDRRSSPTSTDAGAGDSAGGVAWTTRRPRSADTATRLWLGAIDALSSAPATAPQRPARTIANTIHDRLFPRISVILPPFRLPHRMIRHWSDFVVMAFALPP